ncbi:MAG: hypothetical protein FWC76_02795 [Defluviitaleaceae bacterium]|nr:hypothetical protein [Defluviitaleaceae bacterium]
MIKWKNEEIEGAPIYNIVGAEGLAGVHFALANEIVQQGTPFSAENMETIAQKSMMHRYFHYDGEEIVTAAIPVAADGLREGVLLATAHNGSRLYAAGTLYLVAAGRTQRVENPNGWAISGDCTIYCQMGAEATGTITWER